MSTRVKAKARELGVPQEDLDALDNIARGVWILRTGGDVLLFVSRGYRLDVHTIASAGAGAYVLPEDPGPGSEINDLAAELGSGNKAGGSRRALALVQGLITAGALEV